MLLRHGIAPIYDQNSRVLILGSFPSVRSRESSFFYGHPQNGFWPLMARLFHVEIPQTVEEKTLLLLHNHIALWDVIASCELEGSSDATIRNVTANDIRCILETAAITHIYANGHTAERLYQRHIYPLTGKVITALPSTSPANASYNFDRLLEAWTIISSHL